MFYFPLGITQIFIVIFIKFTEMSIHVFIEVIEFADEAFIVDFEFCVLVILNAEHFYISKQF